jgi:hypothetical protein
VQTEKKEMQKYADNDTRTCFFRDINILA